MKEILGYQVDEVAAASRMASLGFVHTVMSSMKHKKISVSCVQFLC